MLYSLWGWTSTSAGTREKHHLGKSRDLTGFQTALTQTSLFWCLSLHPWFQRALVLALLPTSDLPLESAKLVISTICCPALKTLLLLSPLLFMDLCLFFFQINLFIYFWLHWVFVAARGLFLVAASGGYSSLRCAGFSLQWLLLLRTTGSRHVGSSSCGEWAQ